ncbi:alpha-1,2-fucosyltransferase [Acinetobacter guerrae]|uniref:Alpha-1,2-fucosyltransferase n=1 Tax=Acinetobacter guerrae TaxID=1843371 RepID=A0A3A8EI48_9GAMM|nr:alpha-1,2-fucosyltransferase [Acinetobacter guerrae]RKG33166.1 alpha-1,2-fucosyltransferase [Acinetobacter guerrae]
MKVKIIGGLGNQMFQYATTYALAKKRNEKLFLDLSLALNYDVHPLRINKLMCHSGTFETTAPKYEKHVFSPRIPSFLKKYIFFRCYMERKLTFNENLLHEAGTKKLVGYFQCEKYFTEYRDDLLEEFKPKESFSEVQNYIKNMIEQNSSCSMHIRRGDYFTNPEASAYHGLCNHEYFMNALKYLEENKKINRDTKIFIFSDDIDWCKKNIIIDYEAFFVTADDERAEMDMWLMSYCQHNIISNSTFSWWGAWLNQNMNKCVVAPKTWFKNGVNTDIVPESWVKL